MKRAFFLLTPTSSSAALRENAWLNVPAEETETGEERRMEAVECGVPGIRGNRNFTGRTHDH